MAQAYSFCLVLTDDCSTFQLQNNTVYTSPVRSATGDVLVVCQIDSSGAQNYITVDSTPYLSSILYNIPNIVDGHYHFELLEFNQYNGGTSYVAETRDGNSIIVTYANLIYYATTGLFYKCILAGSGIAPDTVTTGIVHWQQITDFTDPEVINNSTIARGTYDSIATCRSKTGVKNTLYNIVLKDPACLDVKTLLPYLKQRIYLIGAESKNSDQKPEQAEVIIEILADLIPPCC